ncbi:MAG: hypothetical protein LBC20_07650 [Planctomycetaceae bacterium]|jgi:ABC-type enterochelin transport system substrate-binding protein|nr:hypothetical protein [Planctomycetaceae bacterium]
MRTFDPDISESDKKENFQKAINHCERASYDILDAQILFYVDICKIFREDYKLIVISNIIHDFLEDCRKIEDIMELLKNTRDKKTYSQQIEKSLEEISTISKKWEIAREELNKTLNDAINKNWQSFIITVRNVIGLFGTGIAFGMVIWKFCFK